MSKKNVNQAQNASASGEATRRDFCLGAVGAGVGVAALAVPVCAGAKMALYPLQQEGLSGKEYELTTLDALDETPRQFVIADNLNDAWATEANQTIGVVYLRRVGEAVEAFQSICPHAGCRIKAGKMKHPVSGEEQTLYFCPCHGDVFELDGERVNPETTKSARSMDSLETRIEGGKVFVKFQNFQLGTAEKKPV
ncbi:MAG: Rieske 2Fe-2S domain-containing protein [Thermoguttaceae bacterium]|nr:Rieske 2Fe-2S domain-containing protein [Thermoguttaceae bacterium]